MEQVNLKQEAELICILAKNAQAELLKAIKDRNQQKQKLVNHTRLFNNQLKSKYKF